MTENPSVNYYIPSVILPILHQRPNEEELEERLKEILDKYFKPTDKLLRAEYRKFFEELNEVLKPKNIRVIDRFKKEIDKYVW